MINPWGNFVAVTDPPVNEQDRQLNSGIYVPSGVLSTDVMNKGVVLGVGPCVRDNQHTPEQFGAGAVIYYRNCDALEVGGPSGDLKFVLASSIIAWEPAPVQAEV